MKPIEIYNKIMNATHGEKLADVHTAMNLAIRQLEHGRQAECLSADIAALSKRTASPKKQMARKAAAKPAAKKPSKPVLAKPAREEAA